MSRERSYSDQELAEAVVASRSWRETLRRLGITTTSAGSIRSAREFAERLGIDYAHFTGHRWDADRVRRAIDASTDWAEVADRLGQSGEAGISTAKGHAARLGIDVAHIKIPAAKKSLDFEPKVARLDRAGSLLAAAWFTMCGNDVSWPLEPARYDLIVHCGRVVRRVQVKTTTTRAGDTWKVYLSTAHRTRRTYEPGEIDDFFIIDGDLVYYVIPIEVVGGLQAIHLRSYDEYRVAKIDGTTKPR